MKIHILHNLREEPWGGGNQFLKALRGEWMRQDAYAHTPEEADAILINSYPFGAEHLFKQLWRIKRQYSEKIVVYRLDGPISLIRQKNQGIDRIIRAWNEAAADGIVFQSHWCEEQNRRVFGISSQYQTVIHNAPDPSIFYPLPAQATLPKDQSGLQCRKACGYPFLAPIKLIATSWSNNLRKGFDVYQFLDEHLDFGKYEMTFVGNSPIRFQHVKMIQPVSSQELATILRDHDIFITASKTDPCSNSLTEALTCGLPAVALKDGGHPELVQDGGELFTGTQDVLEKIDMVAYNLADYRQRLPTFDLSKTADAYRAFAHQILVDARTDHYTSKRARLTDLLTIKRMVATWKAKHLWNKLTGSSN